MEGVVLLDNFAGAVLESMGMELSPLIALMRWVPVTEVGMISPSMIVCVRKGIILTLGLSIECSINCICLFNVIFLHCWAHIRFRGFRGSGFRVRVSGFEVIRFLRSVFWV